MMTPEQFGRLMTKTAIKYDSTYEDFGKLLMQTLKNDFPEIHLKLEQDKMYSFLTPLNDANYAKLIQWLLHC